MEKIVEERDYRGGSDERILQTCNIEKQKRGSGFTKKSTSGRGGGRMRASRHQVTKKDRLGIGGGFRRVQSKPSISQQQKR